MYALLLSIIIIILFAVLLLLVIDYRLSNVKFNIPKQEIIREHFDNTDKSSDSIIHSKPILNQKSESIIPSNKPKVFELDKEFLMQDNIHGNHEISSYKEWNVPKKETTVCYLNHEHSKCSVGYTNYAHPKDMSPIDIKIFTLNYPPNMTLQDYIHWLYCYVGKENKLSYIHLSHLQKLKMGQKIYLEEGKVPPNNIPPMKSEDYFNEMYNISEIDISTPSLSSKNWLGYNEKNYGNSYSDCKFGI